MEKTSQQFDHVIGICRDLFSKKLEDYGAAWRILRPTSITDQIFIKANRIRSFEVKGVQKIEESIRGEYIAIINYAIVALVQLERGTSDNIDMDSKEALECYDRYAQEAKVLMEKKNHDYDEAWRKMRITSYTDLILMKLFRTKQIEDLGGKTLISEGIDANYFDMLNYGVFSMIKLDFGD